MMAYHDTIMQFTKNTTHSIHGNQISRPSAACTSANNSAASGTERQSYQTS